MSFCVERQTGQIFSEFVRRLFRNGADPNESKRCGFVFGAAVRVRLVSGIEDQLAAPQDALGLAEVNHRRGQQADARVAVLLVVPLKELLAEGAAVLEPKRSGNSGRYLRVRNWLSE
jgi:hypothetical protein